MRIESIIRITGISRKFRIFRIIKIIGIIAAVCSSALHIVVEQVSTPTSKRRVSKPDHDRPYQFPSDQGSSPECTINKDGLVCLDNGVVSMKHLDLSRDIPSKTRVMGIQELLGAQLSWGEAFSFFSRLK